MKEALTMAEKINMPQLGESVTEGTISSWLVKEGEHVQKYDPIAEVMTDKVNAEVPSSFTGTIKELVAQEGETIAVGDLMCYIETGNEVDNKSSDTNTQKGAENTYVKEKTQSDNQNKSMKKRYSPAVLKLSQEHNIDLSQVDGTGRGGRITRKDIEKIISTGDIPKENKTTDADKALSKPAQAPSVPLTQQGDIEIPVKGVRKVIAENMVMSTTEIPHAWMTVEVDVTDLAVYRNEIKNQFKQKEGFNLTFFAFFVKAVSQALKEYPQLNSMWAGDKIIQKKDIHLSIA